MIETEALATAEAAGNAAKTTFAGTEPRQPITPRWVVEGEPRFGELA